MSGTNYVDTTAFKSYASIPSTTTTWDSLIGTISRTAYSAINNYCGRVFAYTTTATSARVFRATDFTKITVDDIATSTGLVVATDSGNDATYETVWASTDYELLPLNGLLEGSSWPFTEIRAVGTQTFPVTYLQMDRAHVQVTASWGWPSVPDEVVQAAYIVMEDLFKMKDAPFGIAGTNEFGVVRVRQNMQLQMLLDPFAIHKALL